MFQAIGSIFGFNSNSSLETKPIILFDYKTNIYTYLMRCKPILEQMIDFGLVSRLETCDTVEDFGDPEHFTSYDLNDIIFARSMLKQLSSNPSEIPITSDNDLKQIVKIVMKKYLMEKSCSSKRKVFIKVIVPGSKKIQVVSYTNETKSGEPNFKDPGGSIEENESPQSAAIRELEEELGLIIDHSRLIDDSQSTEKIHKFQVILDEQEYKDYIKCINKLDIDPEITMIALINL